MSTRAIVGVYTGPGEWLGVWNRWGGSPAMLGNWLIREVERLEGDLERLVRERIRRAPGGWGNMQVDPEPDPDPDRAADPDPFLTHRSDAQKLDWLYLFDVADRRLDAIDAGRGGARLLLPYASVSFGLQGQPTPEALEDPRYEPECLAFPIRDGWEGEPAKARQRRLAVAARIAQAAEEMGRTEGDLRDAIRYALERAIRQEPWRTGQDLLLPAGDAWAPDWNPLRVGMWATGKEKTDLRAIRLGAIDLAYPAHPTLRRREGTRGFQAVRPDWAHCSIDVSPAGLARSSGQPEIEPLLLALYEAAASVDIGTQAWLIEEGRDGLGQVSYALYACYAVVAEKTDPRPFPDGTQMTLEEARPIDPGVEIGDELAFLSPFEYDQEWAWTLLDWLRAEPDEA